MAEPQAGMRQQILDTAKALFVNKGYHGMSMREISEALGVSKAALYYHFKDKQELFLAIITAYLDEMSISLDIIMAEPVSSTEQVRRFIEHVLTQPAEQRATIRLASQEIVQLDPEARSSFAVVYREKFTGKIGSILQRGMETGEFRKMDPDVAMHALLGIIYPYLYPAHGGNQPVLADTIRELTQVYLGGIQK